MGGDVFESNDILNDRMEDKEIQTRSGRMIRKPERFKDYDTLQKKGDVMILNFEFMILNFA